VVKEMLTQFALMLRKLADENQGRVIYVPTQETLQPTSKWWANEIHPTSEGFKKIAEVFESTLKQQFPNIDS
jgi:phospholipase/lecithinase/hemolysin